MCMIGHLSDYLFDETTQHSQMKTTMCDTLSPQYEISNNSSVYFAIIPSMCCIINHHMSYHMLILAQNMHQTNVHSPHDKSNVSPHYITISYHHIVNSSLLTMTIAPHTVPSHHRTVPRHLPSYPRTVPSHHCTPPSYAPNIHLTSQNAFTPILNLEKVYIYIYTLNCCTRNCWAKGCLPPKKFA